ncbi:MAG: rod shape-determining protein MreC [Candidatus Buchananbacteria bacterium]
MFDKMIKSSIYGLTAILIAVFFHFAGWLAPVEGLLVTIFSPVQRSVYSVYYGGQNIYSSWVKKRDLIAENEKLRAQLVSLAIDTAKFKALEDENDLLKKEMNFVEENKFKFVAAKIISGVSDPLSQSVIINRGKKDGIEIGLAVIADSGIMVGKVVEAKDDYSKVLLLSDNKSRVAATIQNLDHTVGLVEGQYGLSFSMTNIPQNQEIKDGDLVVTSGLEGKIPKNLLIAKVESVRSVESEIFKTAILKPIISLNSLSDIAVIIP